MRAFVYCRVSTQEQTADDHYSLANQEARCREYIKQRSWQLVKVLKNVGSGKSAERANYQELLQAIGDKQVDVVVVYRLDRLSRNVVDVYSALDAFSRSDVGFASVQEAFDTTTAMGRAMLGVAAVFAQLTREMISENTRDGLARRAQSGKWTGSTRGRPYGYKYVDGRLNVVPHEAEIVRRMFRLYAEQGWGVMRIVTLLNREQVPTKTGLVGRWSAMVVSNILRNPVYAGKVRSGERVFAGLHEAILPDGMFEVAGELIVQRARLAPRCQSTPHLLSGIARCGECRRNLVIHRNRPKPKGTLHVSYRHATSQTGERCLSIHKTAGRMEALVVEQLRALAETPRLREAALAAARQELAAREHPLAAERDDVLHGLAAGENAFDKWVDRLDRGMIDEEQFARINEKYQAEKAQLRKRLLELEQEEERAADLELLVGEVEKTLENFTATWSGLAVDEQRELLRSLVEYLDVYPDRMELKLLFTPAVTLNINFRRGRQAKTGV